MKKIILMGLLFLISACNIGIPSPTAESTSQPTLPPTPQADTATPNFSPTETATITFTPSPEPPPLYFTDEFDSESSYWQFLQTGGANAPTTSFTNSALRVDISSPDTWLIGIHNANSYPNVFVRTKVTTTNHGSVGLVCRYDETNGWYEFNAASDGSYTVLIGQWLAPGVTKYIPIDSGESSKLLEGATDHQLGLFCQDNYLLLYVNDTLIRRVDVTNYGTNYGLTEGMVGITAASFTDVPMSVVFDWVKVSAE